MPDAVSSTPVVSNVSDLMTTTKQVASPNPNGELGKDAFLKLLVAQLKYQDPSSPVDSSQFMAQTAAFTQVEKLDAMAKDSSANLALQQGLAASALVGRTVSYVDENGITQRGVVTSASFGGSGSAEPSVHIGDTAVPLSSIVSVDDGTAPAPGAGDTADGSTDGDAAAAAAEKAAAEQKAMTDAISAALTQAFAGGVTGSIADVVAQAVAAAMAATSGSATATSTDTTTTTDTTATDSTTTDSTTTDSTTTGTDASTATGTGTDATAAPSTGTNPATAGPTS